MGAGTPVGQARNAFGAVGRRAADPRDILAPEMARRDEGTPGGRARRERNPEETRRRILDAAEHEFGCKGYDGTRLRDIALAAGVHHALLHHYYGDKEGLFRSVLERALGSISSRALELLRTTPDIRELVERYVDVVVDFYAENRNLMQILHFATLDEGSPAYSMCEEVADTILLPLLDATTRSIERAQQQGSVRRDVNARRLLVLAMGAAAYVFHEAPFFSLFLGGDVRAAEAIDEHKRATVRLLIEGALATDA